MAADEGIPEAPDQTMLRARLEELAAEHRALDDTIAALHVGPGGADALQVARLKKRKLALKDQMTWIEDQLTPDIIA